MTGLLRKIYLETRLNIVLFSLGLAAVMALLTRLLPKVLGDIERVFEKLPFIKPIITALLGIDPGDQLTSQMTQAFLWVHPTVLSLIWAHELIFCSRMPAGEIDRGSIDFLLGLPVSRWKLYFSETVAWIVSGLIILGSGFAGHLWASQTLGSQMRPTPYATGCVLLNLFGVYLAVGGMAFLLSAVCDRRGRAIGVMFAVLLVSFLLNFLAQFLESARSFSVLSVIEYYRPAEIIRTQQFPIENMATLLILAVCTWLAGGMIFARRSICTV